MALAFLNIKMILISDLSIASKHLAFGLRCGARTLPAAIVLCTGFILGGCNVIPVAEDATNFALEAVGLQKSEDRLADAQKPPRKVAIKLHAGENLNADSAGRPLALVVRIYKLRQMTTFHRVPYDFFLDPRREKEVLGADLLEVKELTLTPGQRFDVIEKISKEADYVGVVALFHTPVSYRWRMAFSAEQAEKSGLTLGLHACAMTVGSGAVSIGSNGESYGLLAPAHCK